jgi:pilus assembly protein FimV
MDHGDIDESDSVLQPEAQEVEDDDIALSSDEINKILDSQDESDAGFAFSTVNKDDVKRLMTYIDELMGSMPEEFVQEFAKSEYFELYKKVMDELDI